MPRLIGDDQLTVLFLGVKELALHHAIGRHHVVVRLVRRKRVDAKVVTADLRNAKQVVRTLDHVEVIGKTPLQFAGIPGPCLGVELLDAVLPSGSPFYRGFDVKSPRGTAIGTL